MGIGLKNRLAVGATPVPDVFIDTYMAGASGEYVKVYLYLLRHQQEEVSIGQIADALNHTEADVQRALAYWQRAGVLGTEVGEEAQRSFPETPGQQISPVFASTVSLAGAGSFAPSAKTAASRVLPFFRFTSTHSAWISPVCSPGAVSPPRLTGTVTASRYGGSSTFSANLP